ncbi:MAG TPA: prepilin-type N-terminal cleavage/methylation domain-containing protein [Candidatus Saccharimonadales bacterium]|nr:prepilin-type N-terminal cleavage/methylation domain-containing protein [Candidatus Saccharimonadales bacterium]
MTDRQNCNSVEPSAGGFTIVELLIATVVFSMVLLLVTEGVLQITGTYYKGVTGANTQTVATNVISTIAQAIQFGGPVMPTLNIGPDTDAAFCVGNIQFSYLLGEQLVGTNTTPLGANQKYHSLVENPLSGNCPATPPQPLHSGGAISGRELLSPQMRLSNLIISSVNGTGQNGIPAAYEITLQVTYGNDDLLISQSQGPNHPTAPDVVCRGSAGDQFCSVTKLSTIVVQRVQ